MTVTPVNDAPTALALSANTVAENAANGTVVGTVSGTDPDAGDTKTYSLTDNAGGRFAINSATGVITVANGTLLDYESTPSHDVIVRVTDSGGLTYDETFAINLTNVNEAPTGADATVTINEDTSHTLTTANFGFSDVDAGDTMSAVRIDSLPSAGTLTLSGMAVTAGQVVTMADITAGNLVFIPAADANGAGYANFTFSVRDSNNAYDPTMNQLTFNLTAVNDAPTDLALSANTVAENAATGTVVGTVSGTDPDAGDTKTYSLTDNAGGRFAINSATGVITVANGTLLDYESTPNHDVIVRVTDSGGLTYDEMFTINLTNVNDAPTDLSLSANTVAENAANGTVVGTVTGTDPDSGDTKSYSLTDAAGGRFAIDSATGVITVADGTLLNYENTSSHDVTVRVTDSGGLTYDETFTINLTDVNEAPTSISLNSNTVEENAANGTVVGTASTMDQDAGDSHTYQLMDNAGGRFAINSSTGQITVADGSLLNYENAISHSVAVRVTDSGGLTYDETFTINLTNVNEAPAGADATVAVNEDTSHTLTTADFGFSDVDAGDNLSAVRIETLPSAGSLTLSGVAVTAGQVVAVSDITAGQLMFTPAADANGTGYADFTFSVRDSNNAYDAAPNTFTLNVTAVNDAPVNQVPGAQTVNEDTPLSLSGLSVNDVDGNLSTVQLAVGNGTLNVTLSGAATITSGDNGTNILTLSGSQADLNATLASLVYQGSLNYTGADTLTVISTDSNAMTDVDTVAITVTAVNDAPTDLSLSANTVAENAATGTVVGTVSGTDPDAGDTKTYSLTDNAGGRFAINSATGVITVADGALLNYENTPSHDVTVRVTDSGGLTYDETFTISLTDVNEAPTDLSLSANTVAENAANGTVVGTVSAVDPDRGDTKSYSLTDTAGGRFAIDRATGVITVADGALLNYENTPSHDVTVRVTDSGGLTYDETFTISLTDVNEAPTSITLSGNTVEENAVNGTVVGTVSALDPDSGDTKTYSLTNNAGGRFAINRATGVITVADGSLLNYEAVTSHNITVRVTDSGGLTYDKTFTITLTDAYEPLPFPSMSGSSVVSHSIVTRENGTAVSSLSDVSSETGKVEFHPPDDRRKAIEIMTETPPPIDPANLEEKHVDVVREQFFGKVESTIEEKEFLPAPVSESKTEGKVTAQDHGNSALLISDHHVDSQQLDRTSESAIGTTMAVGLAGVVLQGAMGAKERLIANIRRSHEHTEGASPDMESELSSEGDSRSLRNESEHDGPISSKPGAA